MKKVKEWFKNTFTEESEKKETAFTGFQVIIVITVVAFFSVGLGYYTAIKLNDKGLLKGDPYVDEFLKNYNNIIDNYYEEVDKSTLINGAIKGMIESLDDPYSNYLTEDESSNFNATLNGEYEGLGVQIVKLKDGNIQIIKVFSGSPAANAGLKERDIITSIDDKIAKDISSTDFVSYVGEKKDNTFLVKYISNNEEKEVTLSRGKITIMSVETTTYEDNIGYIKLDTFASNSYTQFRDKLKELEDKNIKSLIIDLRDNTGGHLGVTQNIISLFLDKTNIMYKTEFKNEIEDFYSLGKTTKTYPIVILVNESTASASEVMAAALQDNLNAYLIGTKTFGKGTIQELNDVNGSNDQYKFTVKKWLTPKGIWIHGEGLEPNLEIERTTIDDNQLEEAIKYLKEK